jgi:hypothetical protein
MAPLPKVPYNLEECGMVVEVFQAFPSVSRPRWTAGAHHRWRRRWNQAISGCRAESLTLTALLLCPDYSKSWTLRSNFLLHLQEREAHMATGGISLICICRLVRLRIFGPGRTLRSRYGRTALRITPAGCWLALAHRGRWMRTSRGGRVV